MAENKKIADYFTYKKFWVPSFNIVTNFSLLGSILDCLFVKKEKYAVLRVDKPKKSAE
ncbi:MAG: hypothetical protein IME96_09925 [Proteobacteria bacterium]|nr:hypothetical protein [Pseudomonadota bacterium]